MTNCIFVTFITFFVIHNRLYIQRESWLCKTNNNNNNNKAISKYLIISILIFLLLFLTYQTNLIQIFSHYFTQLNNFFFLTCLISQLFVFTPSLSVLTIKQSVKEQKYITRHHSMDPRGHLRKLYCFQISSRWHGYPSTQDAQTQKHRVKTSYYQSAALGFNWACYIQSIPMASPRDGTISKYQLSFICFLEK